MKARYFYLFAGVGFVVGAILELRPPKSLYPAVLDLIAAAIFLYLGSIAPQPAAKPPK